jgi:hypothetical protein
MKNEHEMLVCLTEWNDQIDVYDVYASVNSFQIHLQNNISLLLKEDRYSHLLQFEAANQGVHNWRMWE